MSAATTPVQGIRPTEAAKKLGIGQSTLWLKAKNDPDFPKPFKIGPRTTLFLVSELDAYMVAKASLARAD